jgi:hypothetical protein
MSSPWPRRLHLGLTLLLLAGAGAFLALVAAGRVEVGWKAEAPPEEEKEPRPRTPAPKVKSAPGRYQVEALKDATGLLDEVGQLGLLGDRTEQVQVYRYTGGPLECWLECPVPRRTLVLGPVPRDWKKQLAGDREAPPGRLVKQGHVILVELELPRPAWQVLVPYLPPLGGLLAHPAGPAFAPPAALSPEVVRPRDYRLFLSAGPPPGKTGAGFRLWGGRPLPLREALLPRDEEESVTPGGGKDLKPGRTITILRQARGPNVLELKVKFLTDAEAARLRK